MRRLVLTMHSYLDWFKDERSKPTISFRICITMSWTAHLFTLHIDSLLNSKLFPSYQLILNFVWIFSQNKTKLANFTCLKISLLRRFQLLSSFLQYGSFLQNEVKDRHHSDIYWLGDHGCAGVKAYHVIKFNTRTPTVSLEK